MEEMSSEEKTESTPPDKKEEFDGFSADADDSSDEETTSGCLETYDVNTKWQEYADSRETLAEKDEATKLGFIAHAYGLKLLYSPGTNAAYYLLKKSNLRNNHIDNQTGWFHFALEQLFIEVRQLFNNQVNITFQNYKEKYGHYIEGWLPQIKKLMRPLLLWLDGKSPTPALIKFLDELFSSYHAFFCSYFPDQENAVTQCFVAQERCPPNIRQAILAIRQHFVGYNFQQLLAFYTNINIDFRKILESYALGEAMSYLRDLGGLNGNSSFAITKKERQGLKFTPNTRYPLLGEYTKRWYLHKNFKGNQSTNNYLAEPSHIKELVVALILDFDTTPANEKNLLEQARKEFISRCLKHCKAARVHPLYRPTIERSLLPNVFSFQSQNPCAFFANLRLSQRDMKRRQKQLRDDCATQGEVLFGSTVGRSWKFNGSVDALETQEITANQATRMFSRNDKMINSGSYSDVSKEINDLRNMINASPVKTNDRAEQRTQALIITDAKIGEWVRKTLQGHTITEDLTAFRLLAGHQKKLEGLIANLTQLLFGCEGTRNPASLILHQIVLDLIIYEGYPWEKMFCETYVINGLNQTQTNIRLMPMAMENAVSSSRVLHKMFLNFMPQPYQYFGSEEKEKYRDLLKNRYPSLINSWLTYYLKTPQKDLAEAIDESLERWYGITPAQLRLKK